MQYIALDLEWNQAMSPQASVFKRLPFHLRGEIIQIGAVRIGEDMLPADEFIAYIKPMFFKRLHFQVKKLTGISKETLSDAESFPEALERFRKWCGDSSVILTWGSDDKGIFEQNIIIHDLDAEWMSRWINLQKIFNAQIGGGNNQKSLSTAMEHFGIEQTRTAHDALGDAYNAALVCSRLDLHEGILHYDDPLLAASRVQSSPADAPAPIEHVTFREYTTLADGFSDAELTSPSCPLCGGKLENQRWVGQGNRRYMTLAICSEHGTFLIRLKFRKEDLGFWSATRLLYEADQEMREFYHSKSTQTKKRRWRR